MINKCEIDNTTNNQTTRCQNPILVVMKVKVILIFRIMQNMTVKYESDENDIANMRI